jgi:hypothetical protein
MVAVLVVGGTQLLALGIIGEYLGRLHLNVNRKPQYTVRTVLKGHTSAAVASETLGDQREQGEAVIGCKLRVHPPHPKDEANKPAAVQNRIGSA